MTDKTIFDEVTVRETQPSMGSFFFKHYDRFGETKLHYCADGKEIHGSIYYPKNDKPDNAEPTFVNAIKRNVNFFQQHPEFPINLIFIQTTDDWNYFNKSKAVKTQGDRFAGFIIDDFVVMYTPRSLLMETNLFPAQDEVPPEFMEDFMAHEIAHIFTRRTCPKIVETNWLWEGIAMSVGKTCLPNKLKQELFSILERNGYINNFPEDDFLKHQTFSSRPQSHPISYEYGQCFIEYIRSLNKPEWIQLLFTQINEGKTVNEVIEICVGKPFKQFYQEFVLALSKSGEESEAGLRSY